MTRPLTHGDALLLIGLQRDFFAGGAVPVPDADEIIPLINEWIAIAHASGVPIIVTREWHPADHVSFVEGSGSQPAHCVQETPGAAFHPDLRLPPDAVVVRTGMDPAIEPSSAFAGSDLAPRLRNADAHRLWIAGLPLDEEVRATALEALRRDFEVEIIAPATRARTTSHPASAAGVLEELQRAGTFVGGRHVPEVREGTAP
jgi:nicotinamidase/pyrazinamidase